MKFKPRFYLFFIPLILSMETHNISNFKTNFQKFFIDNIDQNKNQKNIQK